MMEAAEFWNFCDPALLHNLKVYWEKLFECKVRARLVVEAESRWPTSSLDAESSR
jgi:hypothetical protein